MKACVGGYVILHLYPTRAFCICEFFSILLLKRKYTIPGKFKNKTYPQSHQPSINISIFGHLFPACWHEDLWACVEEWCLIKWGSDSCPEIPAFTVHWGLECPCPREGKHQWGRRLCHLPPLLSHQKTLGGSHGLQEKEGLWVGRAQETVRPTVHTTVNEAALFLFVLMF